MTDYVPIYQYYFAGTGLRGYIEQQLDRNAEYTDLYMGRSSNGSPFYAQAYKIFFPPGAYELIATGYLRYNDGVAYAAIRMGSPPTILPAKTSRMTGYYVDEVINADCLIKNSGGYTHYLQDYGKKFTTTGQWLYINQSSNSPYLDIWGQCKCDNTYLIPWFDSVEWDDYGNPLETTKTTGNPTPVNPTPVNPFPDYISIHTYWRDADENATGLRGYIEQELDRNTDSTHLTFSNAVVNGSDYPKQKFKMYFPPGVDLSETMGAFSYAKYNDSKHYAGVRYGQPPTTEYPQTVSRTTKPTFSEVSTEDCFVKNDGGYMTYLEDTRTKIITEGGWLYIDQFLSTSDYLTTTGSCVCKNEYLIPWFDSVEWDDYGNPLENTTTTVKPAPNNILYFDPSMYDFVKSPVGSKLKKKIVIRNISDKNISLKTLTMPEGFTYEFVDEFPAYQPFDFYSIYQDGYEFVYTDMNSEKKTITYVGFKNIYDFDNPIVCCYDERSSDCCKNFRGGEDDSTFLSYLFKLKDSKPSLFKIYVPYGTFSLKVDINIIDDDPSVIAISKFKKPPVKFYEDQNSGLTSAIYNTSKKEPYLLDELFNFDCATVRDGNTLRIVDQTLDSDTMTKQYAMESYSGGWLYIIVRANISLISSIKINSMIRFREFDTIDQSIYKSNGDPLDDYYVTPLEAPDAQNPTKYETVVYPYYRAPENEFLIDKASQSISIRDQYLFTIKNILYNYNPTMGPFTPVLKEQIRLFAPPGTIMVAWEWCSQALTGVSVKYQTPPTEPPSTSGPWTKRQLSLEEFKTLNIHIQPWGDIETAFKTLEVPYTDGFKAGDSGWVYAWLMFGVSNAPDSQALNFNVNIKKYNDWWDNAGTNTDGSINWERDVVPWEAYKCNEYKETIRPSQSIRNNTQYISINNPYYRLPNNMGSRTYYMFDSPTPILTYDFIAREEYVLGKSSPNKIRMFVPPGTIKINFYCWGVTRTIIRYNNVPESKEFKDVSYSTPGMVYGLSQLGVEDCFTIPEYVEEGYSGALNTYICRDDISTGLKVSDAGWLYADLEFDTYGKNCIFSLTVNIGLYNEWWDNAGSNDDKSINWDNDIEIVTTYISKSVDV